MATTLYSLDFILKDRFHIKTGFREYQREVIERLLAKDKVLFIARTGHGKSLCYQLPALLFPGMTIVFSPLRALMRDQNKRLNEIYNIPSAIVNSDFEPEDNESTLASAIVGEYKILFIAPERMDNTAWQESIPQMRISMIVIDEAHCISVWGHDFRPFYRRLVSLIQKLPRDTPVLGLTATANHRVELDILHQMGLGTIVYRSRMERPNLRLQIIPVKQEHEKLAFILEYLQKVQGTGVVYTGTQENAEMVARFLQSRNILAEYYHGGLDTEIRHSVQEKWMHNYVKVVCATNALGMGIDKPDIRFIIHHQFPQSPIHYYQEIGRAGRDGKLSDCILLYNPVDKELPFYFIETAKPSSEKYHFLYQLLFENNGLSLLDTMRKTGYPKKTVQQILADLEDQNLITYASKEKFYYLNHAKKEDIDLEDYDIVRQAKLRELDAMLEYGQLDNCLGGFLTHYLGDPSGYSCKICGNCYPQNRFPLPTRQSLQIAVQFLKSDYPRLSAKRGSHEEGIALSYHGKTDIGQLVSGCKYRTHSPFPDILVEQSVDVLRKWYPLNQIDCLLAVPSTHSAPIVDIFAKQIAVKIDKKYHHEIQKTRATKPQKEMRNYIQKKENVKDAFCIENSVYIENQTILLIDDIYDSGQTLKEIGRLLMKNKAKKVYPFTITKTVHSDRD